MRNQFNKMEDQRSARSFRLCIGASAFLYIKCQFTELVRRL